MDSLLERLGESVADMETQREALAEEARRRRLAMFARDAALEAAKVSAPPSAAELESALYIAEREARRLGLPIDFNCFVDESDDVVRMRALAIFEKHDAFYVGGCWGPSERYCGYPGSRGYVRGHQHQWDSMTVIGLRHGRQGADLETQCINDGLDLFPMSSTNKSRKSSGLGSSCVNFVYVCTHPTPSIGPSVC